MQFGLIRPTLADGGVLPSTNAALREVRQRGPAFQPLPQPTRSPFRLSLEEILEAPEIAAIEAAGVLAFHSVGDTGGIRDPHPQQTVADCLERDFQHSRRRPAFFYHLGDVVYYNGDEREYYPQFYSPYSHYPGPIMAIPGNHDGLPSAGSRSLSAFVKHFCAPEPADSDAAGDTVRPNMIQPHVFWTLEAPFVSIVGLYTNVPEGGVVHDDQREWMTEELRRLPSDKALMVALHHPLFSLDKYHSGSQDMVDLVQSAITESGRVPHAVLTAHVHNYQRFTWKIANHEIPVIVAGAGGYHNLHEMLPGPDGQPILTPFAVPQHRIVLEKYSASRFGYLIVEASRRDVTLSYFTANKTEQTLVRTLFDRVVVPVLG